MSINFLLQTVSLLHRDSYVYSLALAQGDRFLILWGMGTLGLASTSSLRTSTVSNCAASPTVQQRPPCSVPTTGPLCSCRLPEKGRGSDKWKPISPSGTISKDTLGSGTPAGLDSISAEGGPLRTAYKKPKNCLEGICERGEKEKGIWGCLSLSHPYFVGCLCSDCILVIFPLFWAELWAKHGKWCWVWQEYKPGSFTLVHSALYMWDMSNTLLFSNKSLWISGIPELASVF